MVLALALIALLTAEPPARAAARWVTHTNTNDVNGFAFEGTTLWAATTGGVVRWNTTTGTYSVMTIDGGLAGTYVSSAIVDPSGNRWFGTNRGASRLASDGTWTTFAAADGLVGNEVDLFSIDSQGRVYAGTSASLTRFDGVHWKAYTDARAAIQENYAAIKPGPQRGLAWAIQPPGNIWTNLGPFVGAQVYDGYGWSGYDHTNGLASDLVDALAVDGSGWVWFGQDVGATRWTGTQWTPFNSSNSGLLAGEVRTVAVGPDDRKWFGVSRCPGVCAGGISVLDDRGTADTADDDWTSYRAASGLPDERIRAVGFAPGGTLWAATGRGLARFDDPRWAAFRTSGQLPGNQVEAALVEPNGTVWAATSGGVGRWGGTAWTTFDARSAGFVASSAHALARAPDGKIWAGIGEAGTGELASWNGQMWNHYPGPGLEVRAVLPQTIRSTVFIWTGTAASGTTGHGRLSSFLASNGSWVLDYKPKGLDVGEFSSIRAIAADAAGNKWIGTDDGLFTFSENNSIDFTNDDRWQRRTTADGLPSNQVAAVAIDAQNRVWVATPLGVAVLRTGSDPFFKGPTHDQWTIYTKSPSGLADSYVNGIAFGNGGTWLATNGGASFRADDGTWTTLTRADGLTGDQVTVVAVAPNGDRWFGTWSAGMSQMLFGQQVDTATPSPSATATASATPSATPSRTALPSATATATRTRTPSPTPSVTPTQTPSSTATVTQTGTPSPAPSATPTASSTATATQTTTASPTPSPTPASAGTATPTPSANATDTPTGVPVPSSTPTPSTTPTAGTATPSPTRTAGPPPQWTATAVMPKWRVFLPALAVDWPAPERTARGR